MVILGITGTIGAGKGTVVDYLKSNHGYFHFSVRNYLTKVLHSEGKPTNRDTFTELANRLRTENNSSSYIIEELYKEAKAIGRPSIIESIRTEGEIQKLKGFGKFYLIAVDADIALRYERITNRKSETDLISFQKFVDDEKREMNSIDPNHQNLSACIALADVKIYNNGNLDELHRQVDLFLSKIKEDL